MPTVLLSVCQSCANCHFISEISPESSGDFNGAIGTCRFNPPGEKGFPLVFDGYLCGQYTVNLEMQKKEDAECQQ